MPEYQRGEIYYVYPSYAEVGSEQWAGRPAVIVSNNTNNKCSQTVEICYMTTKPKMDLPTHVIVHATGKQSSVLCEQITTMDKSRLGDGGMCCNSKEMAQIDEALRLSLGLESCGHEQQDSIDAVAAGLQSLRKNPTPLTIVEPDAPDLRLELAKTEAALDIYRKLYTDLLDRLSATVCASA